MTKNTIFEKLCLFITIIFSVTAIYISYTTHVILAYNDATAHLNTARRVVDNLTPGLVQLGSVWLPLLHILELPFAANFFLWQSGLAGAIVSGTSFVLSGLILYKIVYYLTRKTWAAVFAVLAFITNINLLYLQTTAMFEPLLMVTEFAAVFFLTRWVKERNLYHLIMAAFFIMLATITRYDGWALFLAGCVFVLIVSFSIWRNEGPFFVFIVLAGFGIAMWFLYNKVIFGDALYFARSEFSAASQQEILFQRGDLLTKHNFPLSFQTYTYSMLLNIGVLTIATALMGLLFYLKDSFGKLYYLGPLLLIVPFGFNIIALYLGQSVIWMPMLPPHLATYFNIRYGILMLPAVAFFIGYLASKHAIFKMLAFAAIAGQIFLFLNPAILPVFGQQISIVTLQDTVSSVNTQTRNASTFLHDHYNQGLILVSSASSDAFIFRAGIPLKNFITEGTGYYWRDSLRDPAKFATWLVFFQDKSDRVGKIMPPKEILRKSFVMVYQDQTYQIWKHR